MTILKHPRSFLIWSIILTVFFVSVTIILLISPKITEPRWLSLNFLGVAFFGPFMTGQFLYVQYRLEPMGLRYRTIFHGRGFLKWKNVTRIRYLKYSRWFRIDGTGGEVVYLHPIMTSFSEFARVALQGVPQERIDPDTIKVLEACATGSLPSRWK